MNSNCSIFLQEQIKKAFCYQKLFWSFTVWRNCSSDLQNVANSQPSTSNFKSFSRSLEQFFLTVGRNNFGNKIQFLYLWTDAKAFQKLKNSWETSYHEMSMMLTLLNKMWVKPDFIKKSLVKLTFKEQFAHFLLIFWNTIFFLFWTFLTYQAFQTVPGWQFGANGWCKCPKASLGFSWVWCWIGCLGLQGLRKFFIMSTEFDKNISDWRHNCTDYKNDLDFFLRIVKWPKIAVKKSQIFKKF